MDTGALQALNNLNGLLGSPDTRGGTKALEGQTLFTHPPSERELEAELARVDVQRVQRVAHAGRDLALDLRDLRPERSGRVVTAARELDVVARTEDGGNAALAVVGVMPATLMGGLPMRRVYGVSK